jgi:hypothetical protein
MKAFILLIFFASVSIWAADPKVAADPAPVIETVPAPTVEETSPVHKVDKNAAEGIEETKMGLIKTEKTFTDKNCKMVNGVVKCKKKRVKKKSVDNDPALHDVKKDKE